MKNKIFINLQENIDSPKWLKNIEGFTLKVLDKLNYNLEEVSIFFCDDEYIKNLNNEYRQIDSATDVLSFENDSTYDEEGETWTCVGDIVISIPMIEQNAKYFETTSNDELKRLIVHGVLHLNGFDHGDEHIEKDVEPVCEMLKIQEDLLKQLKDEIVIE